MTKSKRMFAEMLVDIQGFGDPDEISQNNRLVDIIYEIKKAEELNKIKAPEPEPEPALEPIKPKSFWSRLTHDSDDD